MKHIAFCPLCGSEPFWNHEGRCLECNCDLDERLEPEEGEEGFVPKEKL